MAPCQEYWNLLNSLKDGTAIVYAVIAARVAQISLRTIWATNGDGLKLRAFFCAHLLGVEFSLALGVEKTT